MTGLVEYGLATIDMAHITWWAIRYDASWSTIGPITDNPVTDVRAFSVVPVVKVALVDFTIGGDSVHGKFHAVVWDEPLVTGGSPTMSMWRVNRKNGCEISLTNQNNGWKMGVWQALITGLTTLYTYSKLNIVRVKSKINNLHKTFLHVNNYCLSHEYVEVQTILSYNLAFSIPFKKIRTHNIQN